MQYQRFPKAEIKQRLIDSINLAKASLPLEECLHYLKLSKARFHNWMTRMKKCDLEDQVNCPKLSPSKLLSKEVSKIIEYLTDPKFQHYSTVSLSIFAARCGDVIASASSWYRVIIDHGLRRPGLRKYRLKPRMGIRASAPGQLWHLDQSIIKLTDGTRCYVQAVIDNYSRYVLAWHVSKNYGGTRTRDLIYNAIDKAKTFGIVTTPEIMVDSGSENINSHVDNLINKKMMTRTIAQIEVDFSNSLVESLFHRLKNKHLYFQNLSSFEVLVKQTDFYLNEANERIPLAVLRGATPLEVLSKKWNEERVENLKVRMINAKVERITSRRVIKCCA